MKFRKSIPLRYQLLSFFLVIGIGSITVISFYYFNRSKNAILTRTFDQLTSVRVVKKRQVEAFFKDRRQEAALISKSYAATFGNPGNRDIVTNSSQSINYIYDYITKSGYYNELYIIDSSGIYAYIKNHLNKNKLIIDTLNQDQGKLFHILERVREEQKTITTDFIKDPHDDSTLALYVAAPVFLENKNFVGAIALELPLKVINQIMLEQSTTSGLGKSGESYLVGKDFLMRSTSRFRERSVLKTLVKTEGTKKANNNTQGTGIFLDYRGIKVLSSYSPLEIQDMDWIILAEIDFKEAMTKVIQIRNDILYMAVLLGIFIIGMSFFFSGRIISPVLKLKEAALKVEKGQYDTTINIETRNELGALVSAFNSMTRQIKAQTHELLEREERLGHFYDATIDGIILHDSGKPKLINRALTALTGFSENELMNKSLDQIIRCRNNHSEGSYETIAFKNDNTSFPVEIQQSTIDYKGSKINACIIRDISRRKAIELDLMKEREKRLLALFDGQEQERQRLSRELHDSLGQKLVALKLNFGSIKIKETEADKERASSILSQLDHTIKEVRQISSNLMPPVLAEFGLNTGIKQLCNEYAHANKSIIQYNYQGEDLHLPQEKMMYIYRIIQEALNNAVKHAKADEINVQMLKRGNSLVLLIADDGIGFDTSLKQNGNGIFNIRERVNILDGRFQVNSQKGHGTILNIKIPL